MFAFPSLRNASINLSIEFPILQPYIITLMISISHDDIRSHSVSAKMKYHEFRVLEKQLTIIIEEKIDENYFKVFVKYVIRRIFFYLWIVFHYDANHFSNLQKVNIESANRNEFKQWTLKRFKLNRISWLIFELIIINKKFLRLIILLKRDSHDSSLSVNERKIAVNALNKLSDKSK